MLRGSPAQAKHHPVYPIPRKGQHVRLVIEPRVVWSCRALFPCLLFWKLYSHATRSYSFDKECDRMTIVSCTSAAPGTNVTDLLASYTPITW